MWLLLVIHIAKEDSSERDLEIFFIIQLFLKVLSMCCLGNGSSRWQPVLYTMLQQTRSWLSATSALGSLKKEIHCRGYQAFTPWFLMACELYQPFPLAV